MSLLIGWALIGLVTYTGIAFGFVSKGGQMTFKDWAGVPVGLIAMMALGPFAYGVWWLRVGKKEFKA